MGRVHGDSSFKPYSMRLFILVVILYLSLTDNAEARKGGRKKFGKKGMVKSPSSGEESAYSGEHSGGKGGESSLGGKKGKGKGGKGGFRDVTSPASSESTTKPNSGMAPASSAKAPSGNRPEGGNKGQGNRRPNRPSAEQQQACWSQIQEHEAIPGKRQVFRVIVHMCRNILAEKYAADDEPKFTQIDCSKMRRKRMKNSCLKFQEVSEIEANYEKCPHINEERCEKIMEIRENKANKKRGKKIQGRNGGAD